MKRYNEAIVLAVCDQIRHSKATFNIHEIIAEQKEQVEKLDKAIEDKNLAQVTHALGSMYCISVKALWLLGYDEHNILSLIAGSGMFPDFHDFQHGLDVLLKEPPLRGLLAFANAAFANLVEYTGSEIVAWRTLGTICNDTIIRGNNG